jgi:inosose dehydratase
MKSIMYGCQTYPWQMNENKFRGKIPHILQVLSDAGFSGIECEIVMMGDYYKTWGKFSDVLEEYKIKFAALAIHEPWLLPSETEEERYNTDKAIEFLSHFPAAKLLIGHVAVDPVRENNLREKQDNHMKCIRAIGRRAAEKGVVSVFHPNSAPNSIFRYWEDYEVMFEALNGCQVGFAPDVGHMLNGNIDPLKMIKYGREKVLHVHFKDMKSSHEWATMGTGIGEFRQIIDFLSSTNYGGWIIVEDESPDAVLDSDAVVMADGKYIFA